MSRPLTAPSGTPAQPAEPSAAPTRGLPAERLRRLEQAGLRNLNLPLARNGRAASLPELLRLYRDLQRSDPRAARALAACYGFGEDC